jgi:ParB/RepB/Spo0J family partition protein
MAHSAPALVDVDKIDIEDGFNARSHMDDDALERLAASIEESGLVQSIAVRPSGDGRFSVVAGHRRLTAARMGGVEQVPVLIRDGTRAEAIRDSLIENLHQETLDDIDQAHGVKALAEEWGLSTVKEIAARLNLKPSRVGLLLRLLELPEGVQRHIATGVVPAKAERQLRIVAEVSPRIAECVCEYAKRRKIDKVDFVRDFDEILLGTAGARFEDRPTMIPVGQVRLAKVIAEKAKRVELTDRFNALASWDWERTADPVIALGEAEIDAARAAGCLVEYEVDHGDYVSTTALLTDEEMAADLVERWLDGRERVVQEQAERHAAHQDELAAGRAEGKEKDSEARKAAHKEREEGKAKGVRFNEDLHANLLQRRATSRKTHGLARAKAVAKVFIASNPELAGAGLRLVRPQLKDVEVKPLKSGGSREKVSYADKEQSTAFLLERVDAARTDSEVVELLSDSLLCALVADENAIPQSKRIHWWSHAEDEAAKLLAAEIKELRPRRAGSVKTVAGPAASAR